MQVFHQKLILLQSLIQKTNLIKLRKLFYFIFILTPFLAISQEELLPLKYNYSLLNSVKHAENKSINNNDYIFLIDTVNLPVIDDFSTNKFKSYKVDTLHNNILDSIWYSLYYLDGVLIPDSITYMFSPTYSYTYDSVNINGVDTLFIINVPNEPDTILFYNLDFYPVQMDTVVVWPNINYVDSTWTLLNPDFSYSDNDPNYFQDSLQLFFVEPSLSDLSKIWIDNDVYVNDNFPINPWTIGVATFDGLDETGYPYDWSSPTAVGWSDELTSKPIFLEQNNLSDSIYLSFFYQAGGLGEAPDSGDSLVLEFYLPSINSWHHIWSTSGFISDDWFYKHIKLDSSVFLQDGFQFRFRSYGSLNGNLDHWNLDYVFLDENRSIIDTLMNDWAITKPPYSVINNYTSIPWKHYKQLLTNENVKNIIIPTYNSSNNPKLIQPCSMDVIYNGNFQNNYPYSASVLNVPPLSNFDMLFTPGVNFQFDTTITDTFVSFDVRFNISTNTTPERLSVNDTIYHKQVFENYYSYDDGSAEAAYGLVGSGAELAYRFALPSGVNQDTIRAVKIHFSPTVNDVSDDPFFIQIWENDMGAPGNLIYTTDDINLPELYYPEYNLGINGFYDYLLPSHVPVSDTFYIGWKQSSASRLNIGFDKNINRQNDIFYNLGSGFQNTIFEGALMMRPVFISDMDNLLHVPFLQKEKVDVNLYPNPANNWVTLDVSDYSHIEIYDMWGKMILNSTFLNTNRFNTSNWNNGIYLVNIFLENGESIRKKLIIQH